MKPSVVVFDIGGVLVDWDPARAFEPLLGGRAEAEALLARIGFHDLNAKADAGARFTDLTAGLDDEGDRRALAAYVGHFARSVETAIEGTWALLEDLRGRGVPLHAVTNWSAETWPEGLKMHPRLGTAFGVTVVSGQEGIAKPDPGIFALLCSRAGVQPGTCLFIDDSPRNVAAARAFGMDAVQFTDPPALAADLTERGLL
ncbi:HAD family hydrolase [Sinisalibacter lacisalsi]|uniref:Haloacid dehalogenase n=1 Tax=Sinisalibacter lacisalsi TaxID=1526570 RepID=A0ABQ1QNI0_9RHOB|nr:HAD family phosphatase [Sinisalibacter lacisalsi]GGD31370.1 haloacid dehalogenase [Sinisalibacter lacisalsi]